MCLNSFFFHSFDYDGEVQNCRANEEEELSMTMQCQIFSERNKQQTLGNIKYIHEDNSKIRAML